MKRRDFLKLLGIAPFAPSVLKAKANSLKNVTDHKVPDCEVGLLYFEIIPDAQRRVRIYT